MFFSCVTTFLIFFLWSTVKTSPIFTSHEGITTFLSRASAPPQSGNILDLRSSGVPKFEKQTSEDKLDDVDFDKEPENEVVPSLIQKKINKILQKIQLITSLSGGFLQGANGENEGDMNYESTEDESDFDNTNENKINTTIFTSSTADKSDSNNNKSDSVVWNKGNDSDSYRVVFDLDSEKQKEKFDKLEDFDEKVTESYKKSQSTGLKSNGQTTNLFLPLTLAASLMQTFGTILGHAYRSLIHFNRND